MKTITKIEACFSRIEGIRYENEHGGAYAYVQYLAYTRELLELLGSFSRIERELEQIESINWLFNEYLASRFTPRQQSIFEEKMIETKELIEKMRAAIIRYQREHPLSSRKYFQRQAA